MYQFQTSYNQAVAEYLDEAEYSLREETATLSVDELFEDIKTYLAIAHFANRTSSVCSVKVARALQAHRERVVRLLAPARS